MVSANVVLPNLDHMRLYNCWFSQQNLPLFQSTMVKLGIITIVDQKLADSSNGDLVVGQILAVVPNVWDEIGASLDPNSGQTIPDPKGGQPVKTDQTPIQKGGTDAHYVNILTAVDLLPALTALAQDDPAAATIVQRPSDYFFTDAQGKIVDDPIQRRVIL